MTSRLLVDKIEGKTTSGTIQMPSGHVVQTVQNNSNARGTTTTTSTSFTEADTDFRTSITPKFSNSKILFWCKIGIGVENNGSNDARAGVQLYDVTGSAAVSDTATEIRCYDYGGSGLYMQIGTAFDLMMDSWGTTSKTFTFQVKKVAGDTVRINDENNATSITIQEIAQ